MKVSQLASKVRSKNAGPFWITIDLFCDSDDAYQQLKNALHTDTVSKALSIPNNNIKRFDIESLSVIKFSFPRPQIQGSRFDRDMHGAQWAVLLAEHCLT